MNRFAVITLGCKVNQYESDLLAGRLERRGWRRAGKGGPADLVIVNTCTVTGKAAMQARQAVRRAVRTHPTARVIVTGCHAQVAAEEIRKIPGVHAVVGHGDKHRIAELFTDAPVDSDPMPDRVDPGVENPRSFAVASTPVTSLRTRQFLKVQDGCDSFCTYCIVPHARGRSRSMPPDAVMDHMVRLGRGGVKEVVLTGIHLGAYGGDLDPPTDLDTLCGRIQEQRPVARARFSSIEPHELTGGIIRRVAGDPIFCRHFHIPLQSGDDGILRRMHRPYTGAFFEDLVRNIHGHMPEAAIGADILVGFPGETDAAFERSRSLVDALPLTHLHVFPFSPRPGTPASRFPGKVPESVIKQRCDAMRRLGRRKKRLFYSTFLGRRLVVLVESVPDPRSGSLRGFSDNYVQVHVKGDRRLHNTLADVRVDALAGGTTLVGTVV